MIRVALVLAAAAGRTTSPYSGASRPTSLQAAAIIAAAVLALTGVLLTIVSQNRRERTRWLADRRLETYARLTVSIADLAAACETRAEIGHDPGAYPLEIFARTLNEWEKAHASFNEAQHKAALLAGRETLREVMQVSTAIHDMIGLMQKATGSIDQVTGAVTKGDVKALRELKEASARVPAMRDEITNAARREIHPRVPRFLRRRRHTSPPRS